MKRISSVVWVLCMLTVADLGSPPLHAEPSSNAVHVELDPFPFFQGGYGGQVGVRPAALPGVRFAVASFALDVPDAVAELGDNEGFHQRVRPSVGAYAFYYLDAARARGVALGASLRYLRYEFTHDDEPGESATTGQVSIEALAGYKWHPFAAGFFLQPWGGVALTLAERGEATVGTRSYNSFPIGVFATVNLGWELEI